MKAIVSGSIEMVKLIVMYQPDLSLKNDLGLTAMDFIEESENQDVLLLLISPASVHHPGGGKIRTTIPKTGRSTQG